MVFGTTFWFFCSVYYTIYFIIFWSGYRLAQYRIEYKALAEQGNNKRWALDVTYLWFISYEYVVLQWLRYVIHSEGEGVALEHAHESRSSPRVIAPWNRLSNDHLRVLQNE